MVKIQNTENNQKKLAISPDTKEVSRKCIREMAGLRVTSCYKLML